MNISLSNDVLSILETLQCAGYEAYVVGGAVRDLLQGKNVHDWDFTTDATPEQIQKLFPGSFYDNEFGTVGIPKRTEDEGQKTKDEKDQTEIYEITTFRTEQGYSDKRRPDKVEWGKTLEEDLSRRDFTVNAIAMNVVSSSRDRAERSWRAPRDDLFIDCEVIDPYDGQTDLEQKLIRAVGDTNERFSEDALRMMRAIRIGAELGFSIEENTLLAIKKNRELIQHVSWERIRDELLKMIASPFPADGMMLLFSTGLLKYVLPELVSGVNIPQGGHHIYDVFTHSIEALRHCPSADPILRLATLLHDIGKPKTFVLREGKPTFYSHEVVGARIAKQIADRLRFSSDQRDFLWKMIRWHMFAYESHMTDSAIRRFMRRVGKEDIPKMMILRVGDRLGGGSKETSWRLEEFKQRIEGLMHDPLTVADLKIDGNDVMKLLNIKPGPMVGKILNALFEEVLEDPKKNESSYLLSRVPLISESDIDEHQQSS